VLRNRRHAEEVAGIRLAVFITKRTSDGLDLFISENTDTVASHHRVAAAVDDQMRHSRKTFPSVLTGVCCHLISVDDDYLVTVLIGLDVDLRWVDADHLA
jgi:hypothetical protein